MPFSFCITTQDAVLLDCVNIFIQNISIASYYKHLFQVLSPLAALDQQYNVLVSTDSPEERKVQQRQT